MFGLGQLSADKYAARQKKGDYQMHEIDSDGQGVLSKHPALAFVPRFVFVMLKHTLLTTAMIAPDRRIFLHCLLSSLEPRYLCKSFYPTLSSFEDLNTPR